MVMQCRFHRWLARNVLMLFICGYSGVLVADDPAKNAEHDFVRFLYQQFYGRDGDTGGVNYWAQQIHTDVLRPAKVTETFFYAEEFQQTVAPVARLYLAALDRIPDSAGLNFWVNRFRQGATLVQLGTEFVNSDEFQMRFGFNLTDSQFVDQLYRNVLKRAADSEGLNYWIGQLRFMSRGQLLVAFSESPEYISQTAFDIQIALLFEGLFKRALTPNELAFWRSYSVVSTGLIATFLCSGDYAGPAVPLSQSQQEMLTRVNQARAVARQCGTTAFSATTPLQWGCLLEEAAFYHSVDMATHNFMGHIGSDGSTVRSRVENTGYPWQRLGENVAAGYTTVATVMQGWLDSPGHCSNIMNPDFTEFGAAFARNASSDFGIYWTQVFARR